MPPESQKLLTDIFEAAQSIQRFVVNKTFADFKNDDGLRSSNYFKFVIIGEAMSQLRQRDPATAQQISEHMRIIAFRNQIIHGYGRIDDEITWQIIEQKVPTLIHEVQALLKP
jgi:uncharacterized protein with HEPN domain